jgi:hypothetical protein
MLNILLKLHELQLALGALMMEIELWQMQGYQ